MTTIHDVARHAGVSAATVSRVLNGHGTVNPALADRVRRSMDALSYRPSGVARNLRLRRTSLWALVISDIENPFFTALTRSVEDVANAAGFSVVLCNSDEDVDKEAQYVAAAVAERMAGVIISPACERRTDVSPLLDRGIPVVTIDRRLASTAVDAVLVHNARGAREATEHLLERYERVACITGPRGVTTAERRREGWQAALRAAGRPYDEALLRHANYRHHGGRKAMDELLTHPSPPDAVFVANNLMALGALEAIVDAGVRVPEDLGLVEFDDAPWSALMRPSLTSVAQPTQHVGRRAAELLAARIREPGGPVERVTLRTALRVRESSQR